jgi:hypothetical protein
MSRMKHGGISWSLSPPMKTWNENENRWTFLEQLDFSEKNQNQRHAQDGVLTAKNGLASNAERVYDDLLTGFLTN